MFAVAHWLANWVALIAIHLTYVIRNHRDEAGKFNFKWVTFNESANGIQL